MEKEDCTCEDLETGVELMVCGRLTELLEVAVRHWGRRFRMPSIVFAELGMTAGKASYSGWTITLNRTLMRENPEDMIRQTVGHEFAHLVAFAVYGTRIKPHGREWKTIMEVFGLNPKRCHEYDVSNARRRRTKKYTYVCTECGKIFSLGAVRHGRQTRNERIYCCNHCKKPIQYTGE